MINFVKGFEQNQLYTIGVVTCYSNNAQTCKCTGTDRYISILVMYVF